MVKTEPTTATATSTVRVGFVVREIDPQPWQGNKMFLPDFLEIRYHNDYDGKGWRWSADLRGRRINAGHRLGAADANAWFSDRTDRFSTTPNWVREIAEANRPTEAGVPSTHPDARTRLADVDLRKDVLYGTWRGRFPVLVRHVSIMGDEIVLTATDTRGDAVVTDRRRSLLEFVPDPVD